MEQKRQPQPSLTMGVEHVVQHAVQPVWLVRVVAVALALQGSAPEVRYNTVVEHLPALVVPLPCFTRDVICASGLMIQGTHTGKSERKWAGFRNDNPICLALTTPQTSAAIGALARTINRVQEEDADIGETRGMM